jgi:hypothetical protein
MIMPRYSGNGQVCVVVVQQDHYVNEDERTLLDSTLPREVLTQIFDELAPPSERGPLTMNDEMARLSMYAGNGVTSLLDYKNVSFQISRPASTPGDIVAVIQWKGCSCQQPQKSGSKGVLQMRH